MIFIGNIIDYNHIHMTHHHIIKGKYVFFTIQMLDELIALQTNQIPIAYLFIQH